MSLEVPLYDVLGSQYDLMIKWEARLARETPFFRELFQGHGVKRVLDAACGTGQHASLFAGWGLEVVGADPSAQMIRVAKRNFGDAARFVQAGFGDLASAAGGDFDAVVCLGNSLPHLLTREEIANALRDMAATLKPGGILVVHNNNYDRILARGERFMPLSTAGSGGVEYLFFRFFDLDDEVIGFNVATFAHDASGWHMSVNSTRHRALRAAELEELTREAGFQGIERWGSFNKEPYLEEDSDNLIQVAVRGERF